MRSLCRNLSFILAAMFLCAAFVRNANAGGLRRQRVAADAQWVAHLNVDALTHSKLFTAAMEHAGQMHADIEGLHEIQHELGLDPCKDIKDATIYGSGDPEQGNLVIVLTTTGAVDDAVVKLHQQMPIQKVTVGERTFNVVVQEDEKTFFLVRPGQSIDERTVVIARNQEQLIRGVDVLDGKSANLEAEKNAPLSSSASPKAGSFFFAAARGLPWMHDEDDEDGGDPAARVLRTSDRLVIDIGEDGPDCYANLLVSTKSTEDASNVSKIFTGVTAMGSLALSDQKELHDVKSLLDSIRLSTNGNEVRIQIQHDTDDLIRMGVKAAEFAEHEEHHREAGEHAESDAPNAKHADHAEHHHAESQPVHQPH